MTTFVREWNGLALAFSLITVAGCGVVYEPQQFSKSNFSYGYQGDFDVPIDVVPLTFDVAWTANAEEYTPRALPPAFAEGNSVEEVSIRQRLAATGLDRVDPAVVFDQPVGFPAYDGTREVLRQGQRNETRSPLPTLDLNQNPLDARTGSIASGPGGALPSVDTQDVTPVDRLILSRKSLDNPLPQVKPPLYRVGPGDVISLQSRARALPSLGGIAETDGGELAGTQRLLVQDNGEIFIPEIGTVKVSGLSLSEVSDLISERLVENQIGFDTGIQITEFGSKRIAISGMKQNQLIPVTVRPTTLGDAITLSGGIGSNPENMIVRVLRAGTIYEMSGDQVAGSSDLSGRFLLDGDIVSIAPAYDLELALTYFSQQLRQRALERERVADELAQRAETRAERGFELDLVRFENEKIRLQIELENYALQADRLRQEAEIGRLTSRRENDRLNEDARLANILARQSYLDKLREVEQLNRNALRDLRVETRAVRLANQAERTRMRNQLRELLDLELREQQLRLDMEQRSRSLFDSRIRYGAVQQDYVTITGETQRQTTFPLPFDGQLTLNRVLYEETNGIDRTTADTSEIYVFRVPRENSGRKRLTAYHLDASNPAALTVASVFEMRPNDVVYVNPQAITTWNRVLTQILPSTGLLQTGVNAASGGL